MDRTVHQARQRADTSEIQLFIMIVYDRWEMDFGEVEDGHNAGRGANAYSLFPLSEFSIMTARVWKPAHPTPQAIKIAPEDPSLIIQLEERIQELADKINVFPRQ
jgi:hypothetical protein